MQRIGLIGAPGSGKTALAEGLQAKLGHAAIVDGYVPQIERETDLALGFFATYIGNLYVALGRFSRERLEEARAVENKTPYIITCGTLIENQLYAAIEGSNTERYADVPEEHQKRTVVSMQMMGLFMADLFAYDHLFYLPLPEEHKGNLGAFDENLPLAIELWDVKATKLTGTTEERIERALKEVSRPGSSTDNPSDAASE